ncbi:hypothetical protein ACFQL1_19660 [Halomicroarcula sp. GCM10025709]|uniref:hypothetical protein n=1 Tax=Haloarcula TaxID=2237 RepID=UPI0024C2525E|nr:hypothetical protein [Halomicroarcula sp. YJ-61-S]
MPSDSDERTLRTLLGVGSILILAYSLIIAQQILLGVLAIVALWAVYLVWRLISVLERIAGSLEYRIEQSERDADNRLAREGTTEVAEDDSLQDPAVERER